LSAVACRRKVGIKLLGLTAPRKGGSDAFH
jgi:hypothetical protein